MSSIKSRIAQLPNFLGIRKGDFFRSIEAAASGYRGDALKNSTSSVGSDTLVRIMTLYPSVNIRWILIEDGEPICSPSDSIRTDVKISGEISGIGVAVSNGGSNSCGGGTCRTASMQTNDNIVLMSELLRNKDEQITLLTKALSAAQENIRELSKLIQVKNL